MNKNNKKVNLEGSDYSFDTIIVKFPEDGQAVEVEPQARANLSPLALGTNWAD